MVVGMTRGVDRNNVQAQPVQDAILKEMQLCGVLGTADAFGWWLQFSHNLGFAAASATRRARRRRLSAHCLRAKQIVRLAQVHAIVPEQRIGGHGVEIQVGDGPML